MKAASRFVLVAAAGVAAACSVHGVDVPGLTGPSELAQSVTVTATPDSILRDGQSQSSVDVVARGPDGKGIASLVLRLQTALQDESGNDVVQDIGLLSAKTVVTNSEGRATAVYTAPPPSATLGGSGQSVSVRVTPLGTDASAAHVSTVQIRLLPAGPVQPPAVAPKASFVVTPEPVSAGVSTNFDASGSCAVDDPKVPCSTSGITSFIWNFGDGTSSTGQFVTHTFAVEGNYTVSLTVTNDRGLSNRTTQNVSVKTSGPPTAVIVVSPSSPKVGMVLNFNADQSRASAGRTITQYSWNWGDGTPGEVTGFVAQHTYTAAGTYTVVLSVFDDAGQKGTATTTLTVVP
jgi:PKD repeat protein